MTGNGTDYLKIYILFTTIDKKQLPLQGMLNKVSKPKDGSGLTFLKKEVFGPSEVFKKIWHNDIISYLWDILN